jgi:hypothetical protein
LEQDRTDYYANLHRLKFRKGFSMTLPFNRAPMSMLLPSVALGLAITVAPLAGSGFALFGKDLAFAGNGNGNSGGHGNGHGGGNGNAGGHDQAGGKSRGADKSAAAKSKQQKAKTAVATPQKKKKPSDRTLTASSLGKLNGFLHASTTALKHTSPNSAIGRLSKTYADQLASYLSGSMTDPTTGQLGISEITLDQMAETLAGATNKPLTADALNAIHARLAEINPDLAPITDPANPANQNLVNSLVEKVNVIKTASTQ